MNRRDILFRGKRVGREEWVQGDLIHGVGYWKKDKVYILPRVENLATLPGCDPLDGFEVYPSTVGQFTGLLDKNGNRVFEGDVLRTETGGYGYVVWDDAAFAIKSPGSEAIDWVHSSEYAKCEVTGNIHDNPELIKTIEG